MTMPTPAEFRAALEAEGFQEILERDSPPAQSFEIHSHAWDARVLVLAGSFALERDGQRESFGPGGWFEVPRGALHTEGAGPEGAKLLVGRRHP
jgi:quercetin dioxygenase-like cupin family protein